MNSRLFIAGDWGTSNLRLMLCKYRDSGPSLILETINGPGISQVRGDFENLFFELAGNWLDKHGLIPVIISGMAGSTIGWMEAPYIQCPADIQEITQGRVAFEARGVEISIISGLRVQNLLGSPDVMRGEELQLMGWMALNGFDSSNSQGSEIEKLFVLPGTHNKWVLLRQGRIETFLTGLTGELFGLLKNHSVLIANRETDHFDEAAFFMGVNAVERLDSAQLLHCLFSTRSEQVLGDLTAEEGASYLSGLLIASDVMGALSLFKKAAPDISSVTLIGEKHLNERYRLVLDYLGISSDAGDTKQIAIAGYEAIYKHLYIRAC